MYTLAIIIAFEELFHTTNEGGLVTVGIAKIGETDETVCVMFSTLSGTALGGDVDFTTHSDRICFSGSVTEQIVTVDISTDDISEPAETFLLQLSPVENNVTVNIRDNIATVTIVEDQSKYIDPLMHCCLLVFWISAVPLPPTPQLQCSSTTNTISCTWQQEGVNAVTSYLLTWRYTGPCDADSQSFLLDGSTRSHLLEDLEEGGSYSVMLTPMNSAGAGIPANLEVSTQSAGSLPFRVQLFFDVLLHLIYTAPSDAPLSVRVNVVSSDSVNIQWRDVNCLDANGMIEEYRVVYVGDDVEFTVTTSNTMLTVADLRAGVEYSFQVAALNAAGMGPFSDPIVIEIPGKWCQTLKM